MSTQGPATVSLYFPLWGLRFDSDAVGGIGPGVVACVPYPDEWQAVQKTDVWMAQWRSAGGSEQGPEPPCCILAVAALGATDSITAAVDRYGNGLLQAARTAVTVIRLFRPGWFLQPEHAFYTFYAPTLPLNTLRSPGPYRQAFVSGTFQLPMPGLELSLADLTQDARSPGPIAATWQLMQDYRRLGGNSSVEIALESFNRSYGYQLRPSSRAANLFTALDAMLGGMSARKIGKVRINPRGFARRIETALRSASEPLFAGDPRTEARWLNDIHGGRGLRNAIAHGNGRGVEAEAEQAYDRLQAVVRCLLKQYLRFCIAWSTDVDAIARRLDIGADSPLAAAYVLSLEAEARQGGTMRDLLR